MLKLAVYEKVVAYVLFLILRVKTSYSSMREKGLTIITSDDPQKAVYMPEVISLSGVWLGSGGYTEDGLFEMRTLTQIRDVLWAAYEPLESPFGSRLASRTKLSFEI